MAQDIHIVKLNFETPLHIHNERADYAESVKQLHSDMMYAALMQVASLYGKQVSIFDWENGQPTFSISSAFPFTTEGGQTVYFLPRPFKSFDRSKQKPSTWDKKEKDLKSIEWLDLDLYAEHLSNPKGLEINPDWLGKVPTDWKGKQPKAFMTKTGIKPFITNQLEPKVSISREGKDSEPYYLERMYFNDDSGLYLIYKGSDIDFNVFYKLLGFLGQEGIGTDRSSGNGCFNITPETDPSVLGRFESLFAVQSNHATNLSLYCPTDLPELKEGLNTSHAGYTLKKRGGWITTDAFNTLRKRGSYFFAEGSVFAFDAVNKGFNIGTTISLTPKIIQSKNIWRVGKGLFVPINMT